MDNKKDITKHVGIFFRKQITIEGSGQKSRMDKWRKRVMDRKNDMGHHNMLVLTDNRAGWKNLLPHRKLLGKTRGLWNLKAVAKRLKDLQTNMLSFSSLFLRGLPPIVHHSLNNRPWLLSTRHLLQCSASAGGKVRPKLFIRVKWRS